MGATLDRLTGIPNFTGRVMSALVEGKLLHYATKNIAKRIWLRRSRRKAEVEFERDGLAGIGSSFIEQQRAYVALLERRAKAGEQLFQKRDAELASESARRD